jgi:hypothetical protein
MEEGVEMGYDTYIVPFGTSTICYHALGLPPVPLTFGGMTGGAARRHLLYNKYRYSPSSWPWVSG